MDGSAVLLWFRARWSDAVTDKDLLPLRPNWQSPVTGAREGILLACIKACKNGDTIPSTSACVCFFSKLAPQKSHLYRVYSFYLHFALCLFKVRDLLRLSSQSSYTKPHLHPFYPRVRKWMAFQRGCSWIPASCIGSLLDLLSRWELNWKPLSSHHYGSLSPADLK